LIARGGLYARLAQEQALEDDLAKDAVRMEGRA
jgi:hypothetical protein